MVDAKILSLFEIINQYLSVQLYYAQLIFLFNPVFIRDTGQVLRNLGIMLCIGKKIRILPKCMNKLNIDHELIIRCSNSLQAISNLWTKMQSMNILAIGAECIYV